MCTKTQSLLTAIYYLKNTNNLYIITFIEGSISLIY